MDRGVDSNDDSEQTQKSSDQAATATEATTPTTRSTTVTDDESITTTSTESETFETWTLVTDKNKETNSENSKKNMSKAIASADFDDEDTQHKPLDKPGEQQESKDEHDSTIDDYSDGISIISESESAGRVSPQPQELREHLGSLNLNFGFMDDVDHRPLLPKTPIVLSAADFAEVETNQPRERRRKRSSSSNSEKARALQRATAAAAAGSRRHRPSESESNTELLPMIRGGAAGIFYVGVALSLIAFIGRVAYPEWQPMVDGKALAVLEQRVTELELSNNLLRAEIDLMSKQVDHLRTLTAHKFQGGGKVGDAVPLPPASATWHKERKAKTFKAWPGNGNNINPVDITKDELKHPYKCPDGKYVEIAGMCFENKPNAPLADKMDKVVDKIWRQSETLKKQTIHAEGEAGQRDADAVAEKATGEPEINAPNERNVPQNKPFRKEVKFLKDYRRQSSKEHDSDERSFRKQQHSNDERHRHVHDDHDNDDDDNDSNDNNDYSDERYDGMSPQFEFNSKERQGKNHNSKERNNKQWRRTSSGSAEHLHKDGEWHEKLMQQREQARRRNEHQRRDKNWYIERGDSREQMRHR